MATDPTGYISIPLELIRGAAWKRPVACATTANITLSGAQTIDGHAATAGERVLVKDQTTGSQNGIYVVASGAWSRAFDMDQDLTTAVPAEEVLGAFVYVVGGTANGGKVFRATNTSAPTLGTTALTFTEFTSGGGGDTFGDLTWLNVEDYGAVHDGSTDDTVAVQAAIDALCAAGGGTLYFPKGVYAIHGALQDTGTFNSQLEIKQQSSFISVRFLGIGGGSVLRSNWAGTISGTPSVISAGAHDSHTLNPLFVRFVGIRIEVELDPKLTAIDMTKAATFRWDDLSIAPNGSITAVPTHSNAVGVDLPWGVNDQDSGGTDLYVDGFYTGLRPSEQMVAEAVYLTKCARAIEFRGSQGGSDLLAHACTIQRLNVWFCVRGVVFTGDLRWVDIDLMDVEHGDPAPFATVYDIDDASNFARGFIRWHTTDYATGTGTDDLLRNGATKLSLHGGHARRWELNSVVDIPVGTNPSTNPTSGRRLYTDSSSGHLSARDSSGTVIDYETAAALTVKDEGSALATAATSIDFVGAGVTASGTGAAKTVTIAGVTAAAVRDAGRWEPTVDDGTDTLIFDAHTVVMDWTTS